MFGSIFRMQAKSGQAGAVEEHMRRWQRERRPKVAGVVAGYLLTSRDHAGELVGVAVFDSEENYRKNAADPEQDRWYRELRALLQADPEWNDGEILAN
jgi:quinol monooxygenase YgiN